MMENKFFWIVGIFGFITSIWFDWLAFSESSPILIPLLTKAVILILNILSIYFLFLLIYYRNCEDKEQPQHTELKEKITK